MSSWTRASGVFVFAAVCFAAAHASAYSVLTHEQVIDVRWKDGIEPLLRRRFPAATAEDLRRAHAYAYGGSVVPDLGYYPFGSHYFTDLLHYVRSGDFALAMLDDARDVDEYAFALGVLAHYCSDSTGHPAVNRAVAMQFPKLRARYGDAVTYVESPVAHIRTEFGFDVVQVAKNRYTSDRYHDFIGFEVSKPALERALRDTYGLKLDDTLAHPDLAIGSFRRAVSEAIPELTRIALASRRMGEVPEPAGAAERQFVYTLSRADYEKEWGTSYHRPGLFGRIVAFFVRLVSELGPFRKARAQVPTPETEHLYIESMDKTLEAYRERLQEAARGRLALPNLDLDTGRPARFGEYPLADETYARLLHDHADHGYENVSAALREALLAFYRDLDRPSEVKKKRKRWQRTVVELQRLHARAPAPPAPR